MPSTPSPLPFGAHYPTVFGRTGSEADFTPLLQVPPAGGGNQTAVPLAKQGEPTELIRVHRLSSLCAGRARFFALTPSPSPTLWERGVGAHGGAPCSAFPLSRRRERGTKGVRAIQRTCWFTLALGKIAPASKTSCRTVVPLPGGTQGVRTKERACLAATAHGKIAPTPEILYLTAVPLSGVGVRARCLSLYAKTLISRNQSSRVQ